MITWDKGLPFRHNRVLCSRRDPQAEATFWAAQMTKNLASTWSKKSETLVVGTGAGLHISELRRKFPDHVFTSIDCDVELRPDVLIPESASTEEIWLSVIEPRITAGLHVIQFRPSWSGAERHFQRIMDVLLGRSRDALPWLKSDAGTQSWLEKMEPALYLGVKAIVPMNSMESGAPTHRQKVLLALRELVA